MSANDLLGIPAAESDPVEGEREQRWRRGRPAGAAERQSPEDRSYLLLLAAARQRGGSAPQTMEGFEVAHRNRGNGFSVPEEAETTYANVRSFGLETSVGLLTIAS